MRNVSWTNIYLRMRQLEQAEDEKGDTEKKPLIETEPPKGEAMR